jgi:hypothetical protein
VAGPVVEDCTLIRTHSIITDRWHPNRRSIMAWKVEEDKNAYQKIGRVASVLQFS